MLKMIVTDAVISKGYDDAPALRFSENGETPAVRFRIGKRVYDKRAQDSHRWINLNVKAFGRTCERIGNMGLDAGTSVSILGRYDEEKWEDQTSGRERSAPVLIADEIEFSGYDGDRSEKGKNGGESKSRSGDPQKVDPSDGDQGPPDGFTGFEGFSGKTNPFYPS